MSPPPLLPGYVSIRNILDGQIRQNSMVNVVGVIVDCRAPVPTRGTDWKCQLRIYDSSVEQDTESSICLNIFRPSNEMPKAGCGDVVLIRSAKVQKYQMDMPSLITNWKTAISLYQASKIPKPPADASVALHHPIKSKDRLPDNKENAFVSQMYHSIDKDRLPTEVEFESMVLTSTNVKDKFNPLENVKDGMFCDMVVQVVKPPYDMGDKVTLWVSDYTKNESFYEFSYTGDLPGGRDGDPYGYTDKFMDTSSTPSSNWTGPFGKRCVQVTCWEPHATVIRETNIKVGQWVSIRNVQIKLGRNNANLEGFLREDRGANGPKLNICPLTLDDPENINPHMKDALRRKRDYERLKKTQIKDMAEASKAGQKRKSELSTESEPKKKNSRSKRKAKRAQAQLSQKKDEQPIEISDLNSRVKCENMDKPTSFVAEMTEPVYHQTTIDGQDVKLQLPFVNTNYRSNVRVVNFFPSNLVDFARPKKETEFDILSDDGEESLSGSGSEEEEDADQSTLDDFAVKRNWEWRFYLELEDAAVPEKKSKQRMWVAVDNQAAQCLLNLDASNLRHEKKDLQILRDRLFTLWGELEERKSLAQTKKREAQEAARKGKPPSDSDDEDDQPRKTRNSDKAPVSSRPFSCCIRQYGVKVLESDPGKADAGEGKRWQRMYNLFGTRIAG
ncbi:hypothetical protein NW754_011591 [Fusarium falciforme]|uniref:Protection of telomeres protein 1 n=1 Tax=Fusarium falciforme TaxID=195108 RepID=A0A9W8R8D2_9HYPO|nr:hypothetical protein NW754_011591 [Fusarium falciforme]KAJ4187999.1 hypothetical protein NW755_006794 [Fusarium falciforme]KAJ4198579.1 hypothetical protein NW767_008955 [Fusarium falciforme]KAJ4251662.1 hypothetical protein NW757_006497 [Fusarium falciforme]